MSPPSCLFSSPTPPFFLHFTPRSNSLPSRTQTTTNHRNTILPKQLPKNSSSNLSKARGKKEKEKREVSHICVGSKAMERRKRVGEGTHRRGKDTVTPPSFSTSLLDAIYRSFDEDESEPPRHRQQPKRSEAPHLPSLPTLHHNRSRHNQRPPPGIAPRRERRPTAISTSSSSGSSYGGYYASETESARRPPLPVAFGGGAKKTKAEDGTIRSRLRRSRLYRELKKPRTPASPGGRLAAFLNSLFSHPSSRPKEAPAAAAATTACYSAPPRSRQQLSGDATAQLARSRSVRFHPKSVVTEQPPPPPPVRLRPAKGAEEKNEERRRKAAIDRMEEGRRWKEAAIDRIGRARLGLGFEGEDVDVDDDDVASCSSSDLFELEDLKGVVIRGGGGEGERDGYLDELPVYGTTSVGPIMAVTSKGLVV